MNLNLYNAIVRYLFCPFGKSKARSLHAASFTERLLASFKYHRLCMGSGMACIKALPNLPTMPSAFQHIFIGLSAHYHTIDSTGDRYNRTRGTITKRMFGSPACSNGIYEVEVEEGTIYNMPAKDVFHDLLTIDLHYLNRNQNGHYI